MRAVGRTSAPWEPAFGLSSDDVTDVRDRLSLTAQAALACPRCGGRMKVIAFIEPPQGDVIEKILRHCGLWHTSRAPPPSEGGWFTTRTATRTAGRHSTNPGNSSSWTRTRSEPRSNLDRRQPGRIWCVPQAAPAAEPRNLPSARVPTALATLPKPAGGVGGGRPPAVLPLLHPLDCFACGKSDFLSVFVLESSRPIACPFPSCYTGARRGASIPRVWGVQRNGLFSGSSGGSVCCGKDPLKTGAEPSARARQKGPAPTTFAIASTPGNAGRGPMRRRRRKGLREAIFHIFGNPDYQMSYGEHTLLPDEPFFSLFFQAHGDSRNRR